ncbi:separin [Salarias fasciatus]|uniref:separin n=1 Tax=Salarias fasciatus TaxID=181472 RepID=UPI001176E3C2|nr:separin [Salarias fasciatus]
MKCLKVEEYIQRTASVNEAAALLQELETYVRSRPGFQCRTLCDRVIRACNHQLGVASLHFDHVSQLVKLVEISLHGFDLCAALAAQSTPLYMEKIVFHILKKLSSLEVHALCSRVAELLYSRLSAGQQVEEDYHVLVRNCFSVLWNRLNPAKDGTVLNLRDKLHYQMQALGFLLLLDTDGASQPSLKSPKYAVDAITEFEKNCGEVTKDDGHFLLQEMRTSFNRCWPSSQRGEVDESKQFRQTSNVYALSEMALTVVKLLCKAGLYTMASAFLKEIQSKISDCDRCRCTALVLGKWGVKIHSAAKAGKEEGQALTECARALRSLPTTLEDRESHAVLEGCSLVVWAVESGNNKGQSGPALLALFSFQEEHQELILKISNQNSTCQVEASRLQKILCFSVYQGLVFAYESMMASQLENSDTLDRVLLYCQATAGLMMTELHKLQSENLLVKAVVAVSNLACWLYNNRLYDQAFSLVEILCRDLVKNRPGFLSVDRLSRPFMLAVQTSRRAGKLEQALDWVMLWLRALGDKVTSHMAEPVSFWVKTKTDAARNLEDIRLRTLRDGFGSNVPDEQVMLCLLEEELHAYKEVAGDTAQERYNTLCDLLDICHVESPHTHRRAVYLCEMAQVVCFQDFSEQTDCMAVDFTHEALRLLDEETETPENADQLTDDKAHASLWLYICSLEKNLQETIEKDQKWKELQEQTQSVAHLGQNSDLDYEDKHKNQDSMAIYDGLKFNLAAENKLCQPLERALDAWATLFERSAKPSVRNAKQTCTSISVTAALFKLLGKPLKALEAYRLVIGFSRQLDDAQTCARSLCQSASLLLDLGSPEMALAQLEEADKVLSSAEGPSSLSTLIVLLKAQYYYSVGQVHRGVPHLCEVLRSLKEHKQSKSLYMLRAKALQTCSAFLNLDTSQLPPDQRSCITEHGIHTPDSALHESLKLLCSLLVTLVGRGLYGTGGSPSDVRFVDQGDNLVMKWQLLSELLSCSVKMVAMRSACGAVHDARLQCLEALKLAIKLQALSQCAELLVMKAELELMQGEKEECRADLETVRNLLDISIDFSDRVEKADVKIKPRKGRPARRPQSPLPTTEDNLKDILNVRWPAMAPVVNEQGCSPPLKARPLRWLSSLRHKADCPCPCCSEPSLGRATARWAAAAADLVLQLDPNQASVGSDLHWAALSRCKSIATKLGANLLKADPLRSLGKLGFTQDLVGSVYLRMALVGLQPRRDKSCGVWKILEAGLAFVDSSPSPALRPVKAGLMATKAIASLMTLAARRGCAPEEVFSNAWTWNAPKALKELNPNQKTVPAVKKSKYASKKSDLMDQSKEVKKTKAVKTSSTKETGLLPKTPVASRTTRKGRDCFDFNTAVPTLFCTPVQKVKGSSSVQKVPKTASKLQIHVDEELSPLQEKIKPVPAAPRAIKKSRFKVEFSDESDSEAKTPSVSKGKADAPKKRATTRRAVSNVKKSLDPPPEKAPAKRQAKAKKTSAALLVNSSEDDETLVLQSTSSRRGRSRKANVMTDTDSQEEPDKMRTIEEETVEVFEMSIEELRNSDTEETDNPASIHDMDFEVLRRDMCCDLERDGVCELKSRDHLGGEPQTHLSHSDTLSDLQLLDDVRSLLRSAWLTLQHFPSPALYPTICGLLALTTGQQDPMTTAMLHSQSLGVTGRHRTLRHLASSLKKLKKSPSELAEKMDALSLDELKTVPGASAEQMLSQMESIFSFSTAESESFPQKHCQDFAQSIQRLSPGLTVCLISVVGVKPGEMGDSIMLSRLEKGSAPVTVHIPTAKEQHPVTWLVQELDCILVEQKVVSCISEKAKWWDGRRALDSRVEYLLKWMENILGCWKSLLLPVSSDPELSKQSQGLGKALSARGVTVSEDMLKAVLSASPVLSEDDLQRFALGVHPAWDNECNQLLHTAVSKLSDREEPRGHVVLILDKYLQKLPWESTSILRSCSVSRMPSFNSLLGLRIQEADSQSVLEKGVDTSKVFYVLDPDANLVHSQDRFKEWFCSQPGWQGVCGVPPDASQLEEAVATKDLYIYVGHGAGARFLDSQTILKRRMRAASLLFGCSSAALAVRGSQEGQGIILNYLIAGCPFVLGNLWDVTDRDIDRFTKALLDSWLSAGSGATLLEHMGPSRQATHLKNLIGAAPVVYGLPIHLQ